MFFYNFNIYYSKVQNNLIEFESGLFLKRSFPFKNYYQREYYFIKYLCPNGSWIDKGDPICQIRIGELNSLFGYKKVTVFSSIPGYLKHVKVGNEILKEKDCFFELYTNSKDLY